MFGLHHVFCASCVLCIICDMNHVCCTLYGLCAGRVVAVCDVRHMCCALCVLCLMCVLRRVCFSSRVLSCVLHVMCHVCFALCMSTSIFVAGKYILQI